ncbi:MAG: tetratricopeptide repeat protein [Candidatus Melainabacteria bacterium]|jgi:tetratricopeptide (TPR) repeat protein
MFTTKKDFYSFSFAMLLAFILGFNSLISQAKYSNQSYNQAVNDFASQNWQSAIDNFTKAIEIDPDSARAYLQRGVAKRKTNDYSGAIVDYGQAIEIDPDLYEAYVNRGVAKSLLFDYKGAIKDYSSALNIKPNSKSALLNRANGKEKIDDNLGAIDDLTQIIEISQTPIAKAYFRRGLIFYKLDKYNEALQDLQTALSIEQENPDALYNIALVEVKLGYWDKALNKAIKSKEIYKSQGLLEKYQQSDKLVEYIEFKQVPEPSTEQFKPQQGLETDKEEIDKIDN